MSANPLASLRATSAFYGTDGQVLATTALFGAKPCIQPRNVAFDLLDKGIPLVVVLLQMVGEEICSFLTRDVNALARLLAALHDHEIANKVGREFVCKAAAHGLDSHLLTPAEGKPNGPKAQHILPLSKSDKLGKTPAWEKCVLEWEWLQRDADAQNKGLARAGSLIDVVQKSWPVGKTDKLSRYFQEAFLRHKQLLEPYTPFRGTLQFHYVNRAAFEKDLHLFFQIEKQHVTWERMKQVGKDAKITVVTGVVIEGDKLFNDFYTYWPNYLNQGRFPLALVHPKLTKIEAGILFVLKDFPLKFSVGFKFVGMQHSCYFAVVQGTNTRMTTLTLDRTAGRKECPEYALMAPYLPTLCLDVMDELGIDQMEVSCDPPYKDAAKAPEVPLVKAVFNAGVTPFVRHTKRDRETGTETTRVERQFFPRPAIDALFFAPDEPSLVEDRWRTWRIDLQDNAMRVLAEHLRAKEPRVLKRGSLAAFRLDLQPEPLDAVAIDKAAKALQAVKPVVQPSKK